MEDTPEKSSILSKILSSLKGKSDDVDPKAEHDKQVMQRIKQMGQDSQQMNSDEWLQNNVNQPIADAGYPEVGAATAAAASTAKDLLPKDESEFAVGVPVNASASMLGKMKGLASRAEEPVGTAMMNAGARTAEDVAKAKATRDAIEAGADTLVYGGRGGPKRMTAEEMKKLKPE